MIPELNKIYQGISEPMFLGWPGELVVITDPPYGINLDTNYKSNQRGPLDYPPIFGDDKPFEPGPLINKFKRCCLFGANYFANKLPASSSWIIWDKRDGIGINDQADCEIAWTNFGGPARIFRHLWNGMLKDSERKDKRCHPTQKPVALMQWIINKYTKEDDIILDPYCGSGSTLLAAELCGRKWIGIEYSADYCAIAQQRIDAERAQGKLC